MFRLFMAVIATSVALGGAGVATAADAAVQKAPSEPKTMWQSCARIGETDRDLCMVNVTAKNSAAGRQCEELMHAGVPRREASRARGKVAWRGTGKRCYPNPGLAPVCMPLEFL
jgi:hypothetical protein